MEYFLPTYDECVRMCNTVDSAFYENKYVMGGYNVSLFNYRIAQYKDFTTPIEGENLRAFELRGLTFVFNEDGSVYRRFLLLQKFFNLNQTEDTLYDAIKDYTIKEIHNKEDGSIASFIELPNGSILAKSKMSFESEQAVGINRIYRTNEAVRNFVQYTMDNDLVAVFEYVAPHNRIVLMYNTEELILLRVRDNSTGKYISLESLKDEIGDIKVAPLEELRSLDTLIEEKESTKDKEGWVIHAIDNDGNDFFYKIKTVWYFDLHGLFTSDLYREHILVRYIIDEEIDDIITQIPPEETDALERVDKIIDVVKHEINIKAIAILKMVEVFNEMGKSKRDFGMKHQKTPNFGYAMSIINSDGDTTEFDLAKEFIKGQCDKLEKCRAWLMKRDESIFKYLIIVDEDE
jgi:T4 RnlA family RNA ligase